MLQVVDQKCIRGGMLGKSKSIDGQSRARRRQHENGCLWFSIQIILETLAKAFVGRLTKSEVYQSKKM
jgi:hypothetical protein